MAFEAANWFVKIPGQSSDYSEISPFLALAAMPTGYHAARVADAKPWRQGVVIGGWTMYAGYRG